MHKFRVFLSLMFGVLIVAWLTTWYRQHPDRQVVVDPLQPLWNKISVLADRVWWKTNVPENTPQIPVHTTTPSVWTWGLVISPELHPDFVTWTVALADLRSLMQSSKTFWNDSATLVLLQWCDFWSPYCIESYEKWVIFEYMNAFPNTLSYQLKWYPRDTQPTTVLQHQASLCAESLASDEVFLSYYFNIYQARGELSKENLLDLSKRLDIDWFANCLETKNTVALQQEMKRGRMLFNFTSLPANIVVDKQTGEYVLIPWLYETQDVLQAMQRLLNQ
jgi:hypothetical protein